jgi:hypothetical protein|tara:strand:+ start:121 stop:321 length:201 start_codon:yes stop_codon:yes gene_type:complete
MKIKLLVNNKDIWDAYNDELDQMLETTRKSLEKADTDLEIYRYQGEIRMIRKMKQLRDRVNARDAT